MTIKTRDLVGETIRKQIDADRAKQAAASAMLVALKALADPNASVNDLYKNRRVARAAIAAAEAAGIKVQS